MSRPSGEDEDFYDEEALLNIEPEDVDEPEQEDPSEDGIDDDFLKELGKAKQTPFKRILKYFIFLLKGEANNKVRIINLPHPKTGSSAKFVLNSEGSLLEIQRASGLSSWFLNDKCIEDGSLFLTSIVDPLFIILPIIDKIRRATAESPGVFMEAPSLFDNIDSHSSRYLSRFTASLGLICDTKEVGDSTYYRLSEEKAVNWLRYKTERLCEHLESIPDVATLVRAQASGFRSRGATVTPIELVKISIGFMGEYLEKKWVTALESKIGLNSAEATAKAQAVVYATEAEVAPRQKRSQPTDGFEDEMTKELAPTPKKKNIHAARLEKVDKKLVSPITSFFASAKKKE